ncbi:MAG: methyltransferase domain-containing protein [bacterium]
MEKHSEVFMCPSCGGNLEISDTGIKCGDCRNRYQIKDGIPLLFWTNEEKNKEGNITDTIKAFYEKTPFPNYEDFENIGDLIQKARKGIFARLLNKQVPFNIRVLEVGCGTGQLTNFLGVSHRFTFGTDICLNSLRLANNFRAENNLERVGFYQMNLFKPIFKEESFPLVICNGVLHHTADPFAGFQSISRLVKKGGYIIIGLYNGYGRLTTDIRRAVFKFSGGHFKFLDPRLRSKNIGYHKKFTWYKDQYENPHESKHTIGEVLKWFDQTGFDFINSIPKLRDQKPFSEDSNLFNPNPRGNWLEHILIQSRLLFTGGREGGFFTMIGKKKF